MLPPCAKNNTNVVYSLRIISTYVPTRLARNFLETYYANRFMRILTFVCDLNVANLRVTCTHWQTVTKTKANFYWILNFLLNKSTLSIKILLEAFNITVASYKTREIANSRDTTANEGKTHK